ncbi:anaphase-promoting complex subunit 2, partial [Lecanoromycetidae sp. Uapishka_2]
MAAFEKVFASVFPPPSDVDIPTPSATPVLGSSAFGEAFGLLPGNESSAAEQIKWDRAWHIATTYLTLPAEPIRADQDKETLKGTWLKPVSHDIRKALEYVLSENSRGYQIRRASGKDDLLRWYFEEVILQHGQVPDALFKLGQELQTIQIAYLNPLHDTIGQILSESGKSEIAKFESNVHGLFVHTLPANQVAKNIGAFLERQCSIILEIPETPETQGFRTIDARKKLSSVVQGLQSVGLGDYRAQRLFAEVMSNILESYVKSTYAGKWDSGSTIVNELRGWIEEKFARLVGDVLSLLRSESLAPTQEHHDITDFEVEQWQGMGLRRLGILRTDELFDVICNWDESRGAIDDLKTYITVPGARAYLTGTFSNVVSYRLLHPGASTSDILQAYISIIRAFTILDPKGVLLDRVARPIRRYLRDRDDTVNIVVGGLLSDPEDDANAGDALIELAIEMSKTNSLEGEGEGNNDYPDFDDLEWMPDPVDAGPEYKKSKNSDVIGSMISMFESKDIFVKEFQNILGERLLKKEYEFDREIRVLELLKLRFGESALQACEVMLRDILDSRRVDTFIHKDQSLNLNAEDAPQLHTRILSHLFWPSLHSETFFIPPEISSLQNRYSTGFEALKQSRKLTWLHALGQVTVNLDLEDRTVTEEVQTWQASVIHAFQPSNTEDPSMPVTRTFDELLETLEMTEALLQNALTFWVGKLVLRQTSTTPLAYTVLETLSDEEAANPGTLSAATAAAAETATAAAAPAVLSEHEVAQEKMEIYSQFVVGMLTNGGPMPLQQIVMMLKLTVPGGFPFGNEELKSFLEEEVHQGRLAFASGTYRIKH